MTGAARTATSTRERDGAPAKAAAAAPNGTRRANAEASESSPVVVAKKSEQDNTHTPPKKRTLSSSEESSSPRAVAATKNERAKKAKMEKAEESNSGSDVEMVDAEKAVPADFHLSLKDTDAVDIYCVRTKKWLPGRISAVDDEAFTVHYLGWGSGADEHIIKAQAQRRIAPKSTHAGEAWQKHEDKLEKRRRKKELEEQEEQEPKQPVPELVQPPSFVQAGRSRFGRTLTKRILNDPHARKPSANPIPKPVASEPPTRELLNEELLCGNCGEMEDESLTDFLLCDGGCLGSYHLGCLGMESAPEDERWLCEQCRTNEQKCFACDRNGTIGEKGGVFKCSVSGCGKFYHQACINANKLSKRRGKAAAVTEGEEAEDANLDTAPFRCPRHVCTTCEGRKKGSDLMFCLRCPESYHPHCVPPSARYNSVGLLCCRHPHDRLPRIPSYYYADQSIDTVVVDYNLRLPMLFVPKTEPDVTKKNDMHHFRLLLDLVEDVLQQPPTFRRLARSIYTFKQPKPDLEDCPVCVCKDKCGDDCINRLSFTECFGAAPAPGVKLNRQNRDSNCPVGENCGNRALHQKIYPRFERFHTPDKGWALRSLEEVKAGQLVIEYVGEVINEEEKERRLMDHAKNHPQDKNMYIMELGKGEYIDARFKGSVSRFINHSCDPNCRLLKWNVRGTNRIAITALRDIAAGEELSYDYQFHTKEAMAWLCHCKAKNCRGTMAPEKLNIGNGADSQPEKKLTKKEQKKQQKRALMFEKMSQEKDQKATARRLALTAQVSNGGLQTGNNPLVRTGPIQREMEWAVYARVFLRRNARSGFDFLRRKTLKDIKIQARKDAEKVADADDKLSRNRSRSSSPLKKAVVEETAAVDAAARENGSSSTASFVDVPTPATSTEAQ